MQNMSNFTYGSTNVYTNLILTWTIHKYDDHADDDDDDDVVTMRVNLLKRAYTSEILINVQIWAYENLQKKSG